MTAWDKAIAAEKFATRHIGPDLEEAKAMLQTLGYDSLDAFIAAVVPAAIRESAPLDLPPAASEHEALAELREVFSKNKVFRSFIGMGYSGTLTPPVIQRNIIENPGWYTQYTPYQAEIAQGRLAALLNYQTMVSDLTGLPVANASLLDEGTAAAEAMAMAVAAASSDQQRLFFISERCHPQTINVVVTRAKALGVVVEVGAEDSFDFSQKPSGVLLQYPSTDGRVVDYALFNQKARKSGAMIVMATDLLALCLLKTPAELDADVAVGNSQRFGVPLGFGGPHAAFFATKEEHVRKIPGRLVGVSKDAEGKPALRLALQTREQHIRRDKATSNICTSQVLLAVCAGMYAVYHGPKGLRQIAERVHAQAQILAQGLRTLGVALRSEQYFDTICVELGSVQVDALMKAALSQEINLRRLAPESICIALDETTSLADLKAILGLFVQSGQSLPDLEALAQAIKTPSFGAARNSAYLTHPVFNSHHSETEMMRYIRMLEARDLSLTHSMIPLGSCTMKLNAAAELMPITWPAVNGIHPFVPAAQVSGYHQLFADLERWLSAITGFDAFSLQPNSGSQGEYAGLLVIRRYHEARGQAQRQVCLIPSSAHGTNPASAIMAGMKVVVVKCDSEGNVDIVDLQQKATAHSSDLAALMITYPSTHGVFEEGIREICAVIHQHGGQVYMDGANLNAQVGLTKAGHFGPDVCHLNLHKTFCIPHGGGGPGMGPIGVRRHLADYLPNHPVVAMGGKSGVGAVSAAPWGSPSILPISWMYIRMMGADGLTHATKMAILNANYIAKRLSPHYPVVFKGRQGLVAHECIIDLSAFKKSAAIEVDDVAKRLIDYGYHAPTVSWPVPGSLMIEPTESESKTEIDRFCAAMISIRSEIKAVEEGKAAREHNVLKGAPHTAEVVMQSSWDRSYSREQAAYPLPTERKFWPAVARIDNAFGDRNLVCACPPLSDYE